MKADLLSCITTGALPVKKEPEVKAGMLEAFVLVHIIKLRDEKTFYCYVNNVIFPIVKSKLTKVQIMDVVFDI